MPSRLNDHQRAVTTFDERQVAEVTESLNEIKALLERLLAATAVPKAGEEAK